MMGIMTTMKVKRQRSPCLVSGLNTASYMGFLPFHIHYEEKTELYQVAPVNLPRKLICAVLNLLTIYHLLNYLLLNLPSSFSGGISFSLIVLTMSNVSPILQNIFFMVTYWKEQSQLLDIVQRTSVPFEEGWARVHQLISATISIGMSIGLNVIYRNYDPNQTPPAEREIFQWSWWSLWNTIGYHSRTFSYCCVLVALALNQASNEVCSELQQTANIDKISEGLGRYRELKQLSQAIGTTFGTKILLYYLNVVAYFAKTSETYVWTVPARVFGLVLYFSLGAVFWLTSAELHSKVRNAIQQWTSRLQDREDLNLRMSMRLIAAYNENIQDPVGISCKFFTITYGFLGSMTGLIVTYAIIIFQFQVPIEQ